MQHQGRDDIVERAVGERQRAAQGGQLQVRAVTEPLLGLLQHPGAGVEAGHDGVPVAQRREQRAGAAAGVEDPPAGHVPGQGLGPSNIGFYTNNPGQFVVEPGTVDVYVSDSALGGLHGQFTVH
jgi:hypothetical protein